MSANMIEDVCEHDCLRLDEFLFCKSMWALMFWIQKFNILLDNKSEMNSGNVNKGW